MLLLTRLPFLWIFARATGKICNRHIRKPLQIFAPNFFWVVSCSSSLRVLPPSAILSVFLSVFLRERNNAEASFSYSGP